MLASNFRPQYLEQQEYAINVAQLVFPRPSLQCIKFCGFFEGTVVGKSAERGNTVAHGNFVASQCQEQRRKG